MRENSLLAIVKKASIHGELDLWVDGASRGNPGPAASGVVLKTPKGETIKSLGLALGKATNNIAEYSGILLGLQEAMSLGASSIKIFTDSELVARQWNGQYQVKDDTLRVFYRLAKRLAGHFNQVTVSHVPRELNREADAQANLALDTNPIFE